MVSKPCERIAEQKLCILPFSDFYRYFDVIFYIYLTLTYLRMNIFIHALYSSRLRRISVLFGKIYIYAVFSGKHGRETSRHRL